MNIGSQVKFLALTLKKKQGEMAKSCGVDPSTLSNFFNDKSEVRSNTLIKILKTLGIDVASQLESKVSDNLGQKTNSVSIGKDIEILISQMEFLDQKTLLESLINRANLVEPDASPGVKKAQSQLKKYLKNQAAIKA